MYNAASAAEALAFQFQRCFCRKSISFPFPKLPLRQGSEKRHRKTSFFMFFGFRIEKVVFFDASKRSKRLKGEKILPLGCMEATCSDGPFSFLRKVKYK